MVDERWLVVGLGNPGPQYAGTRHNAGFLVVDLLAERAGGRFKAHRGRVDVLEGRISGQPAVLAKPKSYMNTAGGPVAAAVRYFSVPLSRLVVVHDELDLDFARLRVKFGGGDNGHNGLRSLRAALGSGEFFRVRMGVGRPRGGRDPAEYVLRAFTAAERKELPQYLDRAADAVAALLVEGLDVTQNRYND